MQSALSARTCSLHGLAAVPADITLKQFDREEEELFLQLAAAENWITDRNEFAFLRQHYPQGCLAAKVDGKTAAFITAIRYTNSAWIGNLIVAPHHRHKGLGLKLMQTVLRRLDADDCSTVWLTASSDGAALYLRLGFTAIDTIRRWRICGSLQTLLSASVDLRYAANLDSIGWGDRRTALFSCSNSESAWQLMDGGFLRCLQQEEGLQLGPWGAFNDRVAGKLLAKTLQTVSDSGAIFLDVPEKNPNASRLLQANGFTANGGTLLMYRGKPPEFRPELVFALASMGSYG